MPDLPAVPSHAIAAFERVTGLAICIHDHSRSLWSYLPPDRFEHLTPLCRSIKAVRQSACTRFDAERVRAEALRHPEGLIKVCHAGLVEWVVPLIHDGRVSMLLFAGVRRPAPGLERVLHDPSPLSRGGPWSPNLAALPAVDDGDAEWLLESLRQLSERLRSWLLLVAPGGRRDLPRAESIRQHLIQHHTDPAYGLDQLAGHLDLSPSRTGHAVREACGDGFIALLTEIRLRTAAGLLRHTSLPVTQVMTQSGFGNRAHFHQVFKQRFLTSPGTYRREAGPVNSSPAS